MRYRDLLRVLLLLVAAREVWAHATPTPVPVPPFHVESNRIVDAKGQAFRLRGAVLPTLTEAPSPITLRIFRQRWNMNAVRLPVSIAQWRRDGQKYLDVVAAAVATANAENLVAIVTAQGETALPDSGAVDFWRAAAQQLRGASGAILGMFDHPRANDWRSWQSAMQPVVDAIRGAGATQLIAATGREGVGLEGFRRDYYLRDANIVYEAYAPTANTPVFEKSFGFLANDVPLMVASWGGPCERLTIDDAFFALVYLDLRNTSWTIATGSCRVLDDVVMYWMTGDPGGFGSINPMQIASVAGGFPGPVAPGELLSLYGQGIGPETAAAAGLTDGHVDTSTGGVQVFFDGVAAPVLLAAYFQVNVQVPYEVAGQERTKVRLVYRELASNEIELPVAAAAPGIFTTLAGSEAVALNQDGTVNASSNPAPRGTIAVLFATGLGQSDPPSVTGTPSGGPSGGLPAEVTIDGRPSEVLYAGPAPTLVGVAQINVRVPAEIPGGVRRATVALQVRGAVSRAGVTLWVE